MLTRRLLLAASLAVFAGCKSDSNAPTGLNGNVTFTFSGAASGTYNATGTLPTGGNVTTSTWSAGFVSTSEGAVFVESATPGSASTHNFFFLSIARTTAGSAGVDPNCSANVCTDLFFELGAPNSGTAEATQTCVLESGTVVITEITATRVKGTFSGTGTCVSSAGAIDDINVTGGSFDVALVSNIP